MIQRIQTIFLALMATLLVVGTFLPAWQKISPDKTSRAVLDASSLRLETISVSDGASNGAKVITAKQQKNVSYIAIIFLVAAAVAVFEIFSYKKRRTQMLIGSLNSILVLAGVVCLLLASKEGEELIRSGGQGTIGIGAYLPMLALVSNMLANRFIRRDEAKVRSMDRLR